MKYFVYTIVYIISFVNCFQYYVIEDNSNNLTLKVRNSELHQTVGGISTYISGTGKYKKYIGIE